MRKVRAVMGRLTSVVLASALASSGALALAQGGGPEATPTGAGAPIGAGTDPAEATRRAAVLARIGDFTITVGDVEDEINDMSPVMRVRHRDPAQLREYVENMIRLELLAREADRRGYGDDPEVRRTTMESAVQQMIHVEIDERITSASISDQDVLVYYTGHDEEFSRPEMRRASHILVPTREAADALMTEVRAADARAFRALAQAHSEDAETRMRGGDLRFFDATGRGPNTADPAVHAAIAAAAFALAEVGDVSDPIEVDGRFSIVKLMGLRPAETRSVAEAAPAIRMRLFRERRQDALEEMVEALRARIPTEVHYDAMANLRMEPPARASADPHDEEGGEDEDDSIDDVDEGLGAAPVPTPTPPERGEATGEGAGEDFEPSGPGAASGE